MASKAHKGDERVGRFRVNNHVIYQKEMPRSADSEDRVVGKDVPQPRPNRTIMEFTGLRTFDSNRRPLGEISGKVRLEADARGEWNGELVDGDGVHWNFRCVRIKE